jgi:amidase
MIIPEWTISELQEKMESGELTARRLAELYLERISEIDKDGPYINSVIELNPEALEIADTLDAERKEEDAILAWAILIKDNIDTADRMQTTPSLALRLSRQRMHLS